jgi:hypothetical protein
MIGLFVLQPGILPAQNTTFKPSRDTLFVVDGEPVDNIKTLSANSILIVSVLKENALKESTFCTPLKCAVVVNTIKGAIKTYQKRFGDLSDNYRKYLLFNHDSDDLVTYYVNTKPLPNQDKKTIKTLFAIRQEDMREFRFDIALNTSDAKNADLRGLKCSVSIITKK